MGGSAWLRIGGAGLVAASSVLLGGFGLPRPEFMEASRLAPTRDRVALSKDDAERMTVPVRVNGRGPFPFVVDTGADRTVVSRELATTLGLKPGDPVLVNGTGGVDLTPTSQIEDLAVGARTLSDVSAPTLSAANLGAAGLLGIDSLRDQRMVMDFRRRSMSVEPSKRQRFGLDTIVVHARSRYGQLVLVDASIGGEPIIVIVDSGAQNTIGNLALQREVLGDRYAGADLPVEVVSVSGRTTPAHFATIAHVKIGGANFSNLPVAFANLHTFAEFDLEKEPALLLGMDVLRHFDRVEVDFGRKEVSFELPLDG